MTCALSNTPLRPEFSATTALCSAVNSEVPGLAVCSLPDVPHEVHQLRCEETGELLGEWTDADKTFREPANEFQRRIEFSDAPVHELDYGDVA
jgi:hypothetical protein